MYKHCIIAPRQFDLIVTKSISRFARNTVDSLLTQRKLANLKHPVGVYFETENLNSLEQGNDIIMTVLSATAQEESHVKSEIMVQSLKNRFDRGLFLTPELLGYDRDEEGNLVINEEEADTVRLMYYLFLSGFSTDDIAEVLTSLGRETKLGNKKWTGGTVRYILQNERYCGDVISWKTYTYDYLEHKSKKNRGARPRVKQADHHDPIVSHEEWDATQKMFAAHKYGSRGQAFPTLQVVDDGALRGFVSVNRSWNWFSEKDYKDASESAYSGDINEAHDAEQIAGDLPFDLSGYQVVSAQLFSTKRDPAMTISDGKIRFNTACMKKFEDTEYVELLMNTVERCLAIRPCSKDNPNAIRWGALRENGRWAISTKTCRGFAQPLYNIMGWDEECGYRMRGYFMERGEEKLILFNLDEPEVLHRVYETDEAESIENEDNLDGTFKGGSDENDGQPAHLDETSDNPENIGDSLEEVEGKDTTVRTKIITVPASAFNECYGNDAEKSDFLFRIKHSNTWEALRPTVCVEGVQYFSSEQIETWKDKAQEMIDSMRRAV